ncbi:MAG TPA: hypothetical protein VNU01_01635 [Egibacteraceae bacterium]|nr:hypothetical protein [Egibacteraceae bacterium]
MPPFKESVNEGSVRALARRLSAAGAFPARRFTADATRGLESLELKARIAHVVGALERHLPGDFAEAARLVEDAVAGSDLGMWSAWPATDWVAAAGLDHPEIALPLLARLTGVASAEMAIRPFIDRHPARTLRQLRTWTSHPDEHVRRLVSEGSRPRLPWASRIALLEAEPHLTVPLLDALREDSSPYVRRSVANHLNDLNKVDRGLALETASRWSAQGGQHVEAVLRHGLRTLVKAGDAEALGLVGAPPARVRLADLEVLTPRVRLGGSLRFRFTVTSQEREPMRAVIDYLVHHRKANGGTTQKVFKLSTRTLAPGAPVTIERAHAIRPITTRRYYPGEHRVEVQVNGAVLGGGTFILDP